MLPGHEGEAGTHFRKLKSSGIFFQHKLGLHLDGAAVELAGWGGTQVPWCICHAHKGTHCKQRLDCGEPQGVFHVAQD